MRYFYFLFCGLLSVLSASAQTNFKPGYILSEKTDTIKGYIDYREWDKNPKQVIFKTSLNQVSQKITVSNSNGFGINGIEYYKKATVPVSSSTVNISLLPVGIDTTSTIDTAFLRLRVGGSKLNLFELTTGEKTLFYLEDRSTGTITALNQYIFLGDDGHSIIYNNRYIGQLVVFANIYQPNDRKLQRVITRSGYNLDDLSFVVMKINGDAVTAQRVVNNGGSRAFISVGVASRKLSYSGEEAPFSDGKSTNAISPMLSAGLDFLTNKRTERTVFRIEIIASASKYKISETRVINRATENTFNRSLEIKQLALSFIPQIIYNFYSAERLKVFGDLGLGFNYNIFSDQKYRSVDKDGIVEDANNYNFEKFQITIPVKAGVQVGKNLQIFGSYVLPTSVTNYVRWNTKISAVVGGVTYLF